MQRKSGIMLRQEDVTAKINKEDQASEAADDDGLSLRSGNSSNNDFNVRKRRGSGITATSLADDNGRLMIRQHK